jgi:outer membrane protein OmpA-like peptidoglycan-associated protein
MRQYLPYLFLSAGIFLAGCSTSVPPVPPPPVVDDMSCKQLLQQQKLAQKIKGEGVQVVQVGEEVTLVLQTDKFFYFNSNNAKFDRKVLKDIIDFINTYPTVNIQVIGYPNKQGNSVRNLALSREQAHEIARYLWENGLNTRLISGNAKQTMNAFPRIEIFFRLPAPTNVFH